MTDFNSLLRSVEGRPQIPFFESRSPSSFIDSLDEDELLELLTIGEEQGKTPDETLSLIEKGEMDEIAPVLAAAGIAAGYGAYKWMKNRRSGSADTQKKRYKSLRKEIKGHFYARKSGKLEKKAQKEFSKTYKKASGAERFAMGASHPLRYLKHKSKEDRKKALPKDLRHQLKVNKHLKRIEKAEGPRKEKPARHQAVAQHLAGTASKSKKAIKKDWKAQRREQQAGAAREAKSKRSEKYRQLVAKAKETVKSVASPSKPSRRKAANAPEPASYGSE